MARYLRDPQKFAPGAAMPNLGLEPVDAAAVAAYFAELRRQDQHHPEARDKIADARRFTD
jgi:cytochrome c2